MVEVECSKCGMTFEGKTEKQAKKELKSMRKNIILGKILRQTFITDNFLIYLLFFLIK